MVWTIVGGVLLAVGVAMGAVNWSVLLPNSKIKSTFLLVALIPLYLGIFLASPVLGNLFSNNEVILYMLPLLIDGTLLILPISFIKKHSL
jgi:hypothetical protein